MISAPLASSGFEGGSTSIWYSWPAGSIILKPGCTPVLLPPDTTQPSIDTRSIWSGPLTT